MTHLGDRAAALVDGQLDPEGVERAHAHLAGCRPCRDAVEAERSTKARVTALQGPEPAPDLVGRLMALGGPQGPLPPRAGHVPGTPRPQPLGAPAGPRPPAGPAGRRAAAARAVRPGPLGRRRPAGRPRARGRRSRAAVALVGTLSVTVVVGATGLVLGAGAASPAVVPPVDTFVVEHVATTGGLPLTQVPVDWRTVGDPGSAGDGR